MALGREWAYGNVVDPDEVTVVQGDTVTTPDVLRVDIGDSDVPILVSDSFLLRG